LPDRSTGIATKVAPSRKKAPSRLNELLKLRPAPRRCTNVLEEKQRPTRTKDAPDLRQCLNRILYGAQDESGNDTVKTLVGKHQGLSYALNDLRGNGRRRGLLARLCQHSAVGLEADHFCNRSTSLVIGEVEPGTTPQLQHPSLGQPRKKMPVVTQGAPVRRPHPAVKPREYRMMDLQPSTPKERAKKRCQYRRCRTPNTPATMSGYSSNKLAVVLSLDQRPV